MRPATSAAQLALQPAITACHLRLKARWRRQLVLWGRLVVVRLLLVLWLLLILQLVLVLRLVLQGLVRRGHPLLQLVLRVQLEVLLLRLLLLGWAQVLLQGRMVLHRGLLLLLLGAQLVAARHRHVGSGEHLQAEQVQECSIAAVVRRSQPQQACTPRSTRRRHQSCIE